MTKPINRRNFLRKSVVASTALGLSLEEKVLLADENRQIAANTEQSDAKDFPMGKIGNLKISRMIVGGNLTSGNAHSRDLMYVSPLLKNYFTDDKVFETWEISEECGLNTAILRLDDKVIRLINRYWDERGGKLQWIVQIKPKTMSLEYFKTDIQRAIDNGAVGAYLQGNVMDALVQKGEIDLIGEALQCIKDHKVIAGIGGHSIEVPMACEKAGFDPDFYMKTLHSPKYWTFNPANDKWGKFHVINGEAHDNVWCTRQEETIEFMKTVKKPWVAFKVMAAGSIHPKDAFKYAIENGADFICAGMFDFQVREDAIIAREILKSTGKRERSWLG